MLLIGGVVVAVGGLCALAAGLSQLAVLITAAVVAPAQRGYHYLRGRRNRDEGIPCPQCSRRAFPVAGSTAGYRCWQCGMFMGPEHFD